MTSTTAQALPPPSARSDVLKRRFDLSGGNMLSYRLYRGPLPDPECAVQSDIARLR